MTLEELIELNRALIEHLGASLARLDDLEKRIKELENKP